MSLTATLFELMISRVIDWYNNILIYKMEGLNDKLDRVSGDVNQLIELYDFAEKLYPYENIREPTKV